LGSKYMITQLASLGIAQSQPMIITQMLGPAYVVIFVVAQKLIMLPNDLVFIGTSPLISAYGEGKARGDWAWIKGAFKNSLAASVIFGVSLTIGIAVFAKPVIRIWAGAAAVPDNAVILGLAAATLISVCMLPVGQLLVGLGCADILATSLGLCAAATVTLGIVLVHPLGLGGVALAMALSKLLISTPIQLFKLRGILGSAGTSQSQIKRRAQEEESRKVREDAFAPGISEAAVPE